MPRWVEQVAVLPRCVRWAKLGADGEVVSDPSREVLAVDLRPDGDGKDEAKLKLIAGLLGVPFNALRRREAAAARRRLLVTQAVAGTIVLLAVAAGIGGMLSATTRAVTV